MPTKFLSNRSLRDLLEWATQEDRKVLTERLGSTSAVALSAEKLQIEICKVGGHGVANWARGQGTGYIDMLDDAAQALKVEGLPSYAGVVNRIDELVLIGVYKHDISECRRLGAEYVQLAEGKILGKLLEGTYAKLSQEDRRAFDARVNEIAAQFGADPSKKLAGTAGLLALGNLGGFATYTLMSTLLSSVSFGALGFGAYTAASSLLSVALGPIGWVALGAAGVHAYGKPAMKRTVPLIMNIAMLRGRVTALRHR